MLKRFTWTLLTCLMIISLFLVSCSTTDETGGKVTEEDTGQKITVGEEEKTEEETAKQEEGSLSPDVPKYGGTLSIYMPDPVGGFPALRWPSSMP